ncbi:MAG: DUF2922 domain-containing protein [Epulopiscium sp.]|nr:DUF2922 domain-containing protein [Candidatus Epulonipiscium sp.]
MEKKTLQMTFTTEQGSTLTISVGDLREDLTSEEIGIVMDDIVTKRLFTSKKGEVTGKDKARYITQIVEDIAI